MHTIHTMHYSEDFKERVRQIYPDDEDLHRRLESGDVTVGYLLDINTPTSSSLKDVLHASDKAKEAFKRNCKAPEEQIDLYLEWVSLYSAQILKK